MPRRTPQEIEELRRAHRAGVITRHGPHPPPKEKLDTKEKIVKSYGPLPTQWFESGKTKTSSSRDVSTTRFRYIEGKGGKVIKQSEVYSPVEKYVAERFKKRKQPPTNPKSNVTKNSPTASPFYSHNTTPSKKRKLIGVGHGGIRKKQKKSN